MSCNGHYLSVAPDLRSFVTVVLPREWLVNLFPVTSRPALVTIASISKSSAPVWNHFGFEADESGKPRWLCRLRCRVCRQEVAAKDGNTSNVYSQLKTRHPELYADVCNGKLKPKRQIDQLSV